MLAVKSTMLAEQMGWDVIMLTYEQNGASFPYPLSPKVKCVDLNVHFYDAFKVPHPMRYFRKLALRRQLGRALRTFLREQQPDVVICTDKDANELNALSWAHTTEKLVIEAHTGMIDHEMQVLRTESLVRKLSARKDMARLKKAVSQFDALVALTPDDARCWSPLVSTVVIPNFLPGGPCPVADLSVEKKRIIVVGRLDYQKGQDLLLKAWQQVEARHPEWHLELFGDGADSDQQELHALMSAFHLRNAAIHPSTPDITAQYVQSDFLVCSSRWESFGLIIIEAMACGLPVVSFNCDNGPRNIIAEGQNGLLVRNGDVDDMAAKICQLIEHSEQRRQLGANARQSVARFGQKVVFGQYISFLQHL